MTNSLLQTPLIHRLIPIPNLALRGLVQVLAGIAFTALLAQVRIEIGPVPITG